jgi:hypothetical protein
MKSEILAAFEARRKINPTQVSEELNRTVQKLTIKTYKPTEIHPEFKKMVDNCNLGLEFGIAMRNISIPAQYIESNVSCELQTGHIPFLEQLDCMGQDLIIA